MAQETESRTIPRLNVGDWIESAFDWINSTLRPFFQLIRDGVTSATDGIAGILTAPDALIMALIFALLGWLVKSWKLGLLLLVLMTFIISVDQWENAMETLALVAVAAGVALLIGIPLGILAARSDGFSNAIRPVMDLMQTMPAFVWLVPVVVLFSVGVTAGVIGTLIFCLPPGVRFTELGIRQVDSEVVEAGHAFGSSPGQILRRIQLPLALPTIMAGVNQVIMLALSMAVIAGLVGAGGLGSEVVSAISRLDIGLGFEAGLSVVVLAIYLDRLTAALGDSQGGEGSPLMRLLRRAQAQRNTAPIASI
ncbi:MAG TPA: ABC transporter permease subunit [Candidatus Nesterenkonia stercoripullorum]|uniref:ABC transporter permease subunit n=1 Tax=Candidatus Nesterenkonia stercoripullorum TaxID=2838701 RepID=A0A9D1S0M3_9MICC|nr:ABC transporter permease subunit [Candidatus Nesterenkonia stercoripullorum]